MPSMKDFFTRKSALRLFIAAGIAWAAFQTLWLKVFIPRFESLTGGGMMLDMAAGFSYEQARAMIGGYGAEGVRYYNVLQIADTFYPLVYGFFLALGLGLVYTRLSSSGALARRLYLVPVISALCDYGENTGIFIMLRAYPDDFAAAAGITSALGVAKFALLGAALVLLAAGAVVLGLRSIKKP